MRRYLKDLYGDYTTMSDTGYNHFGLLRDVLHWPQDE